MNYFTKFINVLKILTCAVGSEKNVPNVSADAIALAGKIYNQRIAPKGKGLW